MDIHAKSKLIDKNKIIDEIGEDNIVISQNGKLIKASNELIEHMRNRLEKKNN